MSKPTKEKAAATTAPEGPDADDSAAAADPQPVSHEVPSDDPGGTPGGEPSLSPVPPGFASGMPEVSRRAVDAFKAEEEAAEKAASANVGKMDSTGNAFDPSVHAVDENGSPLTTPTGRWKKIGKAARTLKTPQAAEPAKAEPTADEKALLQARTSGVALAQSVFAVCAVIDAEEWRPDKNEETAMEDAFTKYCEIRGVVELPPEVMLAAALIGYGGRRLRKPKTVSWLGARFEGFKAWWQKRRADASRRKYEKSLGEADG